MAETNSTPAGLQELRQEQNSAFDQEVKVLRDKGLADRFCYQEDLGEALDAYASHPTWRFLVASLGDWRGKTVLDLGAGRGLASRLLGGLGARVVALDMNDSKVAGLGALVPPPQGVQPVVGMFEQLPLRPESLDAVVCRWVLHHAGDLPGTLAALRQALRPGGLLLAQAEPLLPVHWSRNRFLTYHRQHFFSDGVHENAYPPWGYRRVLGRAGFDVRVMDILPAPASGSLRARWGDAWHRVPLPKAVRGLVADPRLWTTPLDVTLVAVRR